MKELVEFIARSLVSSPDDVQVRELETEGGLVVELQVHPSDLGAILGRKGRTAGAIRAVMATAAAKTQRVVSLEILD